MVGNYQVMVGHEVGLYQLSWDNLKTMSKEISAEVKNRVISQARARYKNCLMDVDHLVAHHQSPIKEYFSHQRKNDTLTMDAFLENPMSHVTTLFNILNSFLHVSDPVCSRLLDWSSTEPEIDNYLTRLYVDETSKHLVNILSYRCDLPVEDNHLIIPVEKQAHLAVHIKSLLPPRNPMRFNYKVSLQSQTNDWNRILELYDRARWNNKRLPKTPNQALEVQVLAAEKKLQDVMSAASVPFNHLGSVGNLSFNVLPQPTYQFEVDFPSLADMNKIGTALVQVNNDTYTVTTQSQLFTPQNIMGVMDALEYIFS